jgi:anti-sigma factor RsiW
MRHWRARQLLLDLFDDGVEPRLRIRLEAHLRGCEACRRRADEHACVEALVRLLPAALLPCEASAAAQRRLWGLSRWFGDPVAVGRERIGLGAVGVGAAIAAAVLWGAIQVTSPTGGVPARLLILAQAAPDAASALPLGWR